MDRFLHTLRQTLDDFDKLQARFSRGWRPHSNRRSLAILVLFGTIFGVTYTEGIIAPDDFPIRELVEVPEGATLGTVAAALKEQHVIRSQFIFEVTMRALGKDRSARAGDYIFKQPETVWTVAKRISLGAFGLEPTRVRIIEGATTREMAQQLALALPRFDPDAFLVEARPEEGYFFPDTYFFLPNTREEAVREALRNNFDEKIAPLMPDIEESGHSLAEIITMASIIEREAHDPADRRLISGVLWNRIRKNIPLQVDVTFLYTIGKNTFQLTTADLKSDNPYNTYVHKGLPPGPIGSPSLDSIQAAIHPTPSKYLFYLADHSGVTHYSETYQKHLEYKRLYLGT